ncbi:MAG: hypothetical protein V7637_414 [Mycobacteriales bacterium]
MNRVLVTTPAQTPPLTAGAGGPARAGDPAGTLFTWFRAAAQRHPEAAAIEVHADAVSYRELLVLAERLAAALVDAAGRRPVAVGLLGARSLATYAGYLAALRLGATVVPLNPSFPADRNRAMCVAAAVDVLVVDEAGAAQADDVAAGTAMTALRLLSGAESGPGSGPEPGPVRWPALLPAPWPEPYAGTPADVAYTLFTSGSTGAPKGVPIRHRNLAAYVGFCVDRYQVGPGCRLSQTFDLTFDPSVFDMFVAWSSGATLVVPQPGDLLTPARFVAANGITHWFSVPSVVSIARRLRGLRPGSMPTLRWSLFAGEQLTLTQARDWAAAAPGSTLENLYGPTELTITCTGYRLPADPELWPRTSNGTVPIGSVYPHLDGLIVTEDGRAGEDGELCVRGPQRFDGYLDPACDRARFVRYADARATVTDGTPVAGDWYRTGDRVRVEGGELVHLGRLDDQVKIHGYRIELGEIESVLREHPAIHDVVVLPVPAGNGELELRAGYTGRPLDAGELAGAVGRRLPAYMVPARIRYVDRFPVNASGKVDRRRLAAELDAAGD